MKLMRKIQTRHYINDSNWCLIPTKDMTEVRMTAKFFINSLEEHLAAQGKEKRQLLDLGSRSH